MGQSRKILFLSHGFFITANFSIQFSTNDTHVSFCLNIPKDLQERRSAFLFITGL